MSKPEREASQHSLDIDVHPAPAGDEVAAIVAALRLLRRERPGVQAEPDSAWRTAARREGLRSNLSHGPDGWRLQARLEQ